MDSQNIQELMRVEDRKRRRREWTLTPQERMDKYFLLQALANKVLESNPDALAEFHRRNRRKRTESRVQAFEALVRSTYSGSLNDA